MKNFELEYNNLLRDIIYYGEKTNNRTGVDTYTKFNVNLNLKVDRNSFPILTGKKIFFKKALGEFLWMYNGFNDLDFLHKFGVNWWDDFSTNGKDVGNVYGYQIRNYNGNKDQWEFAKNEINNNSRRAVINLWNISDLDEQPLPSCYTQFIFTRINNKLNMQMNFRSSDVFLGLPYDIIIGTLILIRMAEETNLEVSNLGLNLSNAHIYENHIEPIKTYLNSKIFELPKLIGQFPNYELENYNSNNFINTKMN